MALHRHRTPAPSVKRYPFYKPYLREDFGYTCVYCSVHENEFGGHRHFHVEHFQPQSKFPDLILFYPNLMYACGICNSFKGNDWPSDDPLKDGKGYINPCNHDFDHHFEILNDFSVRGLSTVANYMVERLHLNRRHLRRLREKRQREETIFERSQKLYDLAISKLEESLKRVDLPEVAIEAMKLSRDILLENKQNSLRSWTERFIPSFDLNDYR